VTGLGYDSNGNAEISIDGAAGSNTWGDWTQTFGQIPTLSPAANNGAQQPQQPQPKKPSWTQKYLSCVANTVAQDTAWGGIVGGAIGVGGTVLVTGAGAVAGSELGPEGTLAGAGLGFGLSAPFIVPSIATGAIAGAETGVIHGGIACLWGG
jgi:hypothetical protein